MPKSATGSGAKWNRDLHQRWDSAVSFLIFIFLSCFVTTVQIVRFALKCHFTPLSIATPRLNADNGKINSVAVGSQYRKRPKYHRGRSWTRSYVDKYRHSRREYKTVDAKTNRSINTHTIKWEYATGLCVGIFVCVCSINQFGPHSSPALASLFTCCSTLN